VGFAHYSSGALTICGESNGPERGSPASQDNSLQGATESNPSMPLRGSQGSTLSLSKGRRAQDIMSAWFYILRLQSTHFYCGSTRSLEKRTKDHFAGRACRTTRVDHAVALVYSEEYPTYKEALRREYQVKRWSRAKKEALIAGNLTELR
jgi:putative endonuclease